VPGVKSLADQLALDRTAMSLERTMLAYIRTAVALLLSGSSGLLLTEITWVRIAGVILIGFAIGTMVIGMVRYWRRKRELDKYSGVLGEEDD
jgi:putative membrane protein